MKKLYSFASIYLSAVQLNVLQEAPKETDPEACGTCGGRCCKRKPGVIHPLQFGNTPEERIKNMTDALVSKRYVVDYIDYRDEDEGVFKGMEYIRPATAYAHTVPGVAVYEILSGGRCTFLGEKGCELEHERKPAECLGLQPSNRCLPHKTLNAESLTFDEWAKYQDEVKQAAYTAETLLGLEHYWS